jgi:hypothetical protein
MREAKRERDRERGRERGARQVLNVLAVIDLKPTKLLVDKADESGKRSFPPPTFKPVKTN